MTVNGRRVLSPALNVVPKDIVRVKVGGSSRDAGVTITPYVSLAFAHRREWGRGFAPVTI